MEGTLRFSSNKGTNYRRKKDFVSMEQFRVGVIGCGLISAVHIHAINEADRAVLTAVCDIDPKKKEKTAAEQGVRGYLDYRELLAQPDIDAVHICVPHYLHAPISIDALRAGKHVLCEKPMGMSLSEAQAMVQAAKESGKTLTVCFQNRYNDASQRMKQIIDSGEMGKVKGGSAFVCWDRGSAYYADSPWRGKWATEGGSVLINQAIHTLDLMKWLSGGFELKSATMTAKRLAEVIETEDTCDMLLENENGGRFLFFCSNCAADNMPVQLHLLLEKGELHMTGEHLTIIGPDGASFEDYATEAKIGKAYWGNSHTHLIADFYDRLVRGDKPYILPEDGMSTTRLMEEAYLSASTVRRRPQQEKR